MYIFTEMYTFLYTFLAFYLYLNINVNKFAPQGTSPRDVMFIL